MKSLIFGADGMLGHQVAGRLASSGDVIGVVRATPSQRVSAALDGCVVVEGIDVRAGDSWRSFVQRERPDFVVNCVGVVKQRPSAKDPVETIEVNSLFPHQLARACGVAGAKLIQISTDCVFSGERGRYSETDRPDPVDLYGYTKLLGEVGAPNLTLRTSIIGLELAHYSGLVEWFLRQDGDVHGYRKAIWSGLTTAELARLIEAVMNRRSDLEGVWHVASEPISKYVLLATLGRLLRKRSRVIPDDSVVIDRSLNSDAFGAATGYVAPTHETMLTELASMIQKRMESQIA